MPTISLMVGLTLLSLASVGRRVMAQTNVANCDALKTAIEGSDSATSITLTDSFVCTESISITSEIELVGQDNTITIDTTTSDFEKRSLFINEGTFTLRETILTDDDQEDGVSSGVRGIYNDGALNVYRSKFLELNIRVDNLRLEKGGAILSDGGDVVVEDSQFQSNVAKEFGGAICVTAGSISVSESSFDKNEVSKDDTVSGVGQGGDIYVADDVVLDVFTTTFSSSSADFAGSSIKCCGATINNCTFKTSETSIEEESYGALVSGLPDGESCDQDLGVTDCHFSDCSTASSNGQGGAIAIFNTNAQIENTKIVQSMGTAMVFVTNNVEGHLLNLESVEFNQNDQGSNLYDNQDTLQEQATALAIINTAYWGEDEEAEGATISNIYCFANEPYECEVVYHGVTLDFEGELKCQVCDIMGTRELPDDDVGEEEPDVETRVVDDGVDSTSQALIIGLSVALGGTLVVIAALAAYKISARKNARRLMEEMRESDI